MLLGRCRFHPEKDQSRMTSRSVYVHYKSINSITATSLYTEDEGERKWLPEGIPGITLLYLSVVDILLRSVPVSELPVYIQKMKERGDGFQKEFQVSHCYVCL